MKNFMKIFSSNKFKHGTMATVFTAVFIAVIIVINVLFSALTERFPSMNLDLTTGKLNSLSETAIEVADEVELDTTITIIGKEETIKSDTLYASYGFKYSQVGSIAEKMAEANSKISVKYLDPDLNPDYIAKYASDSLLTGKVVVESELRHTVLTVSDMFAQSQNQQTGEKVTYTKVDGALANAVHIVNLDKVPLIAVATGHEEIFTTDARATFDTLMEDNGFQVVEFDILTQDIPEDAQIVMLATPKVDYSNEELAKLNDFLAKTDLGRSVLLTTLPTQGDLPNLDKFLEEWGLSIGNGIVLESDTARTFSNTSNMFLVNANTEIFGEETTYERAISVVASPIEMLFKANNDIVTYPIFQTANTAYVVEEDGDTVENPDTSVQTVSAMGQRLNNTDNGTTYSSVLVLDTYPLLQDFLGSSMFSNREAIITLLQHVSGVSKGSMSLYVESTETNVIDIAASYGTLTMVGFYICTIAIPLLILVAGLVIFLKRRHL